MCVGRVVGTTDGHLSLLPVSDKGNASFGRKALASQVHKKGWLLF